MAKLPMKAVKNQRDLYNMQETITFYDDGKEYQVNYYPFFTKERVEKVVQELSNAVSELSNEGIDAIPDTKSFANLAQYFAIKEFTDISTPKDNYKKDIQFYKTFYNTDYWDTIVEAIPESEFAKIIDLSFKVVEEAEKLKRQVEDVQNEVQSMDFQSKEVEQYVKGKQIPEQ